MIMEETGRLEIVEYPLGRMVPTAERIRPEMAFLAENPEAFGLIPDACPLATGHLLIAANGYGAEGGASLPVYEMERPDVSGLLELYGDILAYTEDAEEALNAVFGESRNLRAHPVSRFSAALAELVALEVMNGPANGASYEQTLVLLNNRLRHGMQALRDRFAELEQVEILRDTLFEPSVGICRIREEGNDDYVVDIFAAGDFHIYILDEQGMAPLWSMRTPPFSTEGASGFAGKSMPLHHPGSFAVLLVSDSICMLNAAESRGLRSNPGMIWRYRMRLEDYFLRLITDCVREYEFGDRAARFFVGHSHGRDSASGAIAVMRDGVSYETFRLRCNTRLTALERQMELLPNGYDPHGIPVRESRARVEMKYLQNLLDQSPELSDRLANALRLCILWKFERREDAETPALAEEIPEYRRLSMSEILPLFEQLDRENDSDRARIRDNHDILKESLAEHWITLRPVLLEGASQENMQNQPEGLDARGSRGYRGNRVELVNLVNDEIYGLCLDMNCRLSEMLSRRQKALDRVRELMVCGLEAADAEGKDWVCGRAGADSVHAWLSPLRNELPALMALMDDSWAEDTDRYRSLLAAYTAERDSLFGRDTRADGGAFAEDWRALLEGRIPDAQWARWREALAEGAETAGFVGFLDAVRRISEGCGVLLARIRGRATENRVAREVSNRMDLRLAALRGSAYEDPDWGDDVLAVMDTTARNEFRATVRHWQEDCRQSERQKRAFETYSAMYEAYEREEKL